MLHGIILNSAEELLTALSAHYCYMPELSVLENTSVDKNIDIPRPENAPQVHTQKKIEIYPLV